MSARHTDTASLWLPGFGNDDVQVFPDLFDELPSTTPDLTPALQPRDDKTPRRRWRPEIPHEVAARVDGWPHWADSALDGLDDAVTKFEANLTAIATMRALIAARRATRADERRALLRFTGWGGIPASFNRSGKDAAWNRRADRLADTLGATEYEAARASVNNSHYTEPSLARWIWAVLQKIGFVGGNVLEPSAGIGHFIGNMPRSLALASRITAIEIDPTAGAILELLYAPAGVDVRIQGAEEAALADDSFDLVISNVPFGAYSVSDIRIRAYSRFSIHNWFVGKALDVVKPDGLVCLISSSYLLDAMNPQARLYAASRAELLTAFRLPQGTF
jgi:hypothetical protein